MDKYEQVARDIISDTKNTMFYLGSEYTKAINKTTNYLRSQFPEPQKIEGVRELVESISGYEIMSNAHDSWFVEIEHGQYIARSVLEKLITDFITAREAKKPILCTRCKDPIKVGVCENCIPAEKETAEADK